VGTDIHGVLQRKLPNGHWETYREGYADRNYDAFAILADVRNGTGFAGIETSEGFKCISEPRGFPEDFDFDQESYCHHYDKDIFEWNDRSWRIPEDEEEQVYWMGDHSHSFVTAADLLNIDWNTTVKKYGVISEESYKIRRDRHQTSAPDLYSGVVMGPNIVTLTEDQYREAELQISLPQGKDIYVKIAWTETYSQAVGRNFLAFVLRVVQDSMRNGGLHTVRFVFGFDS
jgi:hypothetical protein